MKRILILFLLFLPMLCFGQNIITHVNLSYVPQKADLLPGDFYVMEISPGYQDNYFRIVILQKDSNSKENIIKDILIETKLDVHRKDYKLPDGKYEWDFETWIKSNDIYSDEIINIGNCSNQRKLSASLRLQSGEKYSIRVHYNDIHFFEFRIDPENENKYEKVYN